MSFRAQASKPGLYDLQQLAPKGSSHCSEVHVLGRVYLFQIDILCGACACLCVCGCVRVNFTVVTLFTVPCREIETGFFKDGK